VTDGRDTLDRLPGMPALAALGVALSLAGGSKSLKSKKC
jgi:hypothetical protein